MDVVIVGAGPVGLALAGLLGQAGHEVVVIERYASLYGLPRAIRFDGEAMRLFQRLGIVEEIEPEIVASDSYVWYGADGGVIVQIDSSEPAPSGWASSYSFWQPTLEAALERAATDRGSVSLRRGWAAEGLAQHPDQVRISLRRGEEPAAGQWVASDETASVSARYVVGADGANSVIRGAVGIERQDFGFRERWVVVDVRPRDMSRWIAAPVAAQHCDPRRPTVQVRNGATHMRWEFMLLPGENSNMFVDPGRVWPLLAPYITPDAGTLVRSAVYEFTGTLAHTLRSERVVLAGDAAHTMPPFMAEGMCTGLRDATNLAWRLDLLLRGVAGEGLLDAYTSERLPHAQALIELSIAMGRVSCELDPDRAAGRDAARSGEVPPPPPLPGLVEGTLQAPPRPGSVAGQLTVQGTVRAPDGRSGRFDDIVGGGFALVSARGDPTTGLDDAQLRFLRDLGAHSVSLDSSVPDGLTDVDGPLTRWMVDRGVAAFIARPDGYAFGAVTNATELPVLVDELRAAVTGPVGAGID